jgi:hypothetical protein
LNGRVSLEAREIRRRRAAADLAIGPVRDRRLVDDGIERPRRDAAILAPFAGEDVVDVDALSLRSRSTLRAFQKKSSAPSFCSRT